MSKIIDSLNNPIKFTDHVRFEEEHDFIANNQF
jgi:hypothetical protein